MIKFFFELSDASINMTRRNISGKVEMADAFPLSPFFFVLTVLITVTSSSRQLALLMASLKIYECKYSVRRSKGN